ncbi:MAG: cytochrome bc1 complex Rieske iron-sulfur subunit [Nocardioidaceae bacterium]
MSDASDKLSHEVSVESSRPGAGSSDQSSSHDEVGAHDTSGQDMSLLPDTSAEPVADPGLPSHQSRPTDVDPKLERRAERQVAGMFIASAILTVLFCVAYFAIDEDDTFLNYGASNLALGLTLGVAMVLIGVGAIQWAKKLMTDEEIIEYRHSAASTVEDRAEALQAFRAGADESGFGRRTLVRNSLLGSLAVLGLPAVVLLRDLGPLPSKDALEKTVWTKGMRVVRDVSGEPLRPSDIPVGNLVNAEPEVFFEGVGPDGEAVAAEYEGVELHNEKSKAAVILVRMQPEDITPAEGREDWDVDGVVCYSKICTHAGCPISLWEQQTHNLLCPCHQSTFDLEDSGRVVFGPSARALPQLQLGVDEEGYLIAMNSFEEPVGPSYWERG